MIILHNSYHLLFDFSGGIRFNDLAPGEGDRKLSNHK